MNHPQIIATRRALRIVALMPWLVVATAAAGLTWAITPAFVHRAEVPECNTTLPEVQIRAGEQRT